MPLTSASSPNGHITWPPDTALVALRLVLTRPGLPTPSAVRQEAAQPYPGAPTPPPRLPAGQPSTCSERGLSSALGPAQWDYGHRPRHMCNTRLLTTHCCLAPPNTQGRGCKSGHKAHELHMYLYVYAHMYTHIYGYTKTHTCMMHTRMDTHTYTHAWIHIRTHTNTCGDMHI